MSTTFAKSVRDTIAEEKTQGVLSYCDIFPDTQIKKGDASVKKWSLEGSTQANYLATSPSGTATGFGAKVIIIDDLIKNDKEAYNEVVLQGHFDWFANTMLSRTENRLQNHHSYDALGYKGFSRTSAREIPRRGAH